MNAWLWLVIAGLFEIQWAVTLKYTEGFTRLWPSVFCIVGMIISVYGLSMAQKTLPLGTSYAVWVGIGILGAAICGMFLFNEPKTLVRFACILLILAGIVGLKVTSPS
ncbi:QacE family quaternary ammonium compound efflux SMR transporter [Alkanindiges hydrocarboniclasticus]|jgi:quaternary ammonium compound-resistance protein SugE|uniref:Guanidinium exporter n=1 Tax=Alkanindiges hydrocarboniclasticus TaxID=1907941 RepID=A0A1S8CTD7_9GAMM|nr:multidrug efflux SMR transporter [Alkanindiges hydrocarboniclasticus]ONG38978.1 QacE family quaternary ammonium compound efflux SMR transporter [Alkanindiges hydrocarboniclasticus]